MFDHLSLGTANLERSLAFYDAVLSPLGIRRCIELDHAVGYGTDDHPTFWVGQAVQLAVGTPLSVEFHLAFQASSRQAVDAFYEAALAAGAQGNGKLGLDPHYHAALVIDPDGYRIQAICHRPEAVSLPIAPSRAMVSAVG